MKARVKETGEIIEVDVSYGVYVKRGTDDIYGDDALDFDLSEPEEEVTIEGWIARDSQEGQDGIGAGEIYLYPCKPIRKEKWFAIPNDIEYNAAIRLDKSLFPSITFQNSPLEVTFTIKPKKK